VRQDRKDARLKQILAGVFKQSRIALTANDLVVNAARFFASSDFTDESSIAVPDRKLSYRGRLRNRKKISAFERRAVSLRNTCST
jgi:hypothetical protein